MIYALEPKIVEIHPKGEEDTLTYVDLEERQKLETQIGKTFYEKGKALKEIGDRRLYRDKWRTFEDYCSDRFGLSKSTCYRFITSAEIYEEILAFVAKLETNCSVIPKCESQCRELSALLPEHRSGAWELAVSLANGRVPSAAKVKAAVRQIREELRQNAPNPYKGGEICTVISSDVTGRKGRWCLVNSVKGAYCHCCDYQGQFKAHCEDLKELELTPAEKEFMVSLRDRLEALFESTGDHLKPNRVYFSKLQRGHLSEAETQLLETLEANL